MPRFEKIGAHRIYFDETYFIAYAGGKRALSEKDQKEYNKTLQLPLILQRKELRKIPMEKNPNVFPIKGINLMTIVKEMGGVPFFDYFFEQTKTLQITDRIAYEAMRNKNYDIEFKNNKRER